MKEKIRVPNKISNFRKTLNGIFQLNKEKKKISAKNILTNLNKMNYFRDESNLLNSLKLLQNLKIISSKKIKIGNLSLNNLKKIKIKTTNLSSKEIKEKIFQ